MADFSYTPYEAQTIQDHIIKHYGNISRTVMVKECESLDLKLYVIEPTKERDFYTVVTSGMGAYKMDIPDDFKDDNVDRIELLIYLSSNWDIDSAFKASSSGSSTGLIIDGSVTPLLGNINAQWNYPIQILKNLAQAPVNNESYFVMGNIMDDETPFSWYINISSIYNRRRAGMHTSQWGKSRLFTDYAYYNKRNRACCKLK